MRAALLCLAACSSMPDVNQNPLGESGHATLAMTPDKQSVNALGATLTVSNTGNRASGSLGARLVDGDTSAFRISRSDCTVLEPGGTCTIDVELTGVSLGTATIELDEDNEPKATAELAGMLAPAIKWQEDGVALSSSDCSVDGPGGVITQTIHLKYADVMIENVQITSSDPNNYRIVNNSCPTAPGMTGTCTVGVQVTRGASGAMAISNASITAALTGVPAATIPTSYTLAMCDLTLAPTPLEIDAGHRAGAMTLKNRSAVTPHTIASAMFMNSNTVGLMNACSPGLTLAPGAHCDATFTYTPSTMPAGDGFRYAYTVATTDGLALTGLVDAALNDTKIHFEEDDYDFGVVHLGGGGVSKTVRVLADSSGELPILTLFVNGSAGPTTFTIDTAVPNMCNVVNAGGECELLIDFNMAPLPVGSYWGLLTAKGTNGEWAYATLEGEVL